MEGNNSLVPNRTSGLTGRPFAGLSRPNVSHKVGESPAFAHFTAKRKSTTRNLNNAAARTAVEKIALAACATTRLQTSGSKRAVRVQVLDVVVVVTRDEKNRNGLFVVSCFVLGFPDDADHLPRVLAVAAHVSSLVAIDDRLSLLGGSS
jgi:hypothetical protein